MNLIDVVNTDHASKNLKNIPAFRTGDTLEVHVKIKEGDKSRVQIYEGICVAIKDGRSMNGHFCVRKTSGGIGVERIFPFHSPSVDKVVILQKGKARKSKLYFLRERAGKSARVQIDYDRNEEA
jgi:large subunit ribosomal protein L19